MVTKRKTRVQIKIKEYNTTIKEFEGRFLGLVEDDGYKQLLNRPEVAHRAFTSPSDSITNTHNSVGMRAVFATTTYHPQYCRSLVVTPPIKYSITCNDVLTITCKDNKEYVVEEVKK